MDADVKTGMMVTRGEKPMLEDACVISWTNDLVAWGNHRPYMTGRFGTSGKQLLKTPAITDITQ